MKTKINETTTQKHANIYIKVNGQIKILIPKDTLTHKILFTNSNTIRGKMLEFENSFN